MSVFSEVLNQLILERKMRPLDLARGVRGDMASVTSWLNGTLLPQPEIIDKIAQCLHVDKQWLRSKAGSPLIQDESSVRLIDWKNLSEQQGILLPFLGRVWCREGFWCELHNERAIVVVEKSRKISDIPARFFLIESLGDRMEDHGINDEDLLLCCFQDTAEPGDIIVALCSDDFVTIKEYWRLPDKTPVLRGGKKRTWFEGIQILEILGRFLGKVKGRRIT